MKRDVKFYFAQRFCWIKRVRFREDETLKIYLFIHRFICTISDSKHSDIFSTRVEKNWLLGNKDKYNEWYKSQCLGLLNYMKWRNILLK